MANHQLSELNPNSRDWTVQVFVSRLWHHRGGTDDGPIKHTDFVFHDTEGNHMYGEISQGLVDKFIQVIREGRMYELKRFLVCPKKNCYRPVEGQYIIRFGRYTAVREITDAVMDYPLCTYALTAIDALPRPCDMPECFTDVVGVITGVSPITQYHSASRSTPSTKRVIYLSDLSGYQISIVLWGERATAFDGEGVLQTARNGPVVAIFVGMLVKPFEGRRGLSGSAPCRWYINEDLPEITELLTQLSGRVPLVQGISLPGQSAAEISAQVDLETKTVKELVDLNIWEHAKTKFYCTVVITKLSPGQRWWFHACTTCNKGTLPYGDGYKCSDRDCAGTGGTPRYRLCYIASDGTDEVELVFFEKAGKELIGKPVLTLLRSKVPHGMPVEEAIQFGRTDQSTPRELASIVSRKYRLVVSVTTKSFDPESEKPSYQVHRIEAQHGKQIHSAAVGRRSGLSLAGKPCGVGLALAGQSSRGGLALSSEESDGALNKLGESLIESGTCDQGNSSEVASDLTDVQTSTNLALSVDASGNSLSQTPSSVSKLPADSRENIGAVSSVQRALFQDSPPPSVPENMLVFKSPDAPKKDDDSTSQLAQSTSNLSDNKRRRGASQKNTVDKEAKKKKL